MFSSIVCFIKVGVSCFDGWFVVFGYWLVLDAFTKRYIFNYWGVKSSKIFLRESESVFRFESRR